MKMTKTQAKAFDDEFFEQLMALYKVSGEERFNVSGEFVTTYLEGNEELIQSIAFGALKVFSYLISKQIIEDRKKAEADAVANAFSK